MINLREHKEGKSQKTSESSVSSVVKTPPPTVIPAQPVIPTPTVIPAQAGIQGLALVRLGLNRTT